MVADLSGLAHDLTVSLVRAALEKTHDARRQNGFPHWVVLDEAHYLLHREGVDTGIGIENKGFCLVTYRPSWLRDSVVKDLDVLMLARTTAAEELSFLRARLGAVEGVERALATLPDLPDGKFVLIEPEAAGTALTFVTVPRETAHVRHLSKYVKSGAPSAEGFIFRGADGHAIARANNLRAFRRIVAEVADAVLAQHAGQGDFSRWVLDVFSDQELSRQLRKMETRWRRGEIPDLRAAINRLIALRYGPDV